MREILDFFKDVFMIERETRLNIGLTQFKKKNITEQPVVKQKTCKKKEPTLSELMRRSAH